MLETLIERASFAGRHDFDLLPRSADIQVRPAELPELSALAEMANRLVPGVQIGADSLGRYFEFDPNCILTFCRRGKLLGAVAFLYLNDAGLDALVLDEMSLTHPDMKFLARQDEEVSAIYVWAIAGQGRAMAGLGNVSEHLSRPRLVFADLYAHPATAAGRDLMVTLGFKPIPSFQPDLWCYQRPWNRVPKAGSGVETLSYHSTRSIADARY
jgi:hypothetical protein